MNRKVKLWIAIMSFFVVILALAAVVPITWQHYGPVFRLSPPEAITMIGGEELVDREVRFPNLLPLQSRHFFDSEKSLLRVGDIVEVDMNSPTIVGADGWMIAISTKPVVDKYVNVVYHFYIPEEPHVLLTKNGLVRLRIINLGFNGKINGFREKDGYFFLDDFYNVEVIR